MTDFTKPNPSTSYAAWNKSKTPENLHQVLSAHMPDIRRNLAIYKGSLSPELMEAEAKKLAIGAIKSFDPKAGASLKTHIVNHLQRLNRITQTRSRAFRMPEELQQQVKNYTDIYQGLVEELGREPTVGEIASHMKWPLSKVKRLKHQFVQEIPEGTQVYEGGLSHDTPIDPKLEYVYSDLTPRDQIIFEHLTGFGGKPIKKKSDIAKIVGVSPAIITQRAQHIHAKIKEVSGMTEEN